MTERVSSSESSAYFFQTTQHYIPEDNTLLIHCCRNLRLNISNVFLSFVFTVSSTVQIIGADLSTNMSRNLLDIRKVSLDGISDPR
jgi:hypothetical protein